MRNRNYKQQGLYRFGMTMMVMGGSFLLYYLGLFGGVEGPLNPDRIGDALAGTGLTRTYFKAFFVLLLIITISWNWIYNLISLWIGSRLTCKRKTDDEGAVCGASVKRNKIVHKKTGQMIDQYVCIHGHKRPDAHFHPVKKGAFSHTLWAISLCFCIMVFFM